MSDVDPYRETLGLTDDEEEREIPPLIEQPEAPPEVMPITPASADPYREALGLNTSPMYERSRGQIPAPDPANGLAGALAASENPVAEITRLNATEYIADTLDLEPSYVYGNLDTLSEHWYGEILPADTFAQNVRNAWDNGMQNYELAKLAVQLRDTGGTDEELVQKITEIEENMEPLADIPRPWIQQALLWAAESSPLMAQSFLRGGIQAAATGAAAGLTAGAVAAPLSGGLSVPAMTMAMASVGFAVGTTQDMIAVMRGLSYWRMRKENVPHEIAAPLADIEGIISGSIESVGSILLGMKIPGLTPALKSAGALISNRLVASGVVGQVATRVVSQLVGGALAEGIEEPLQELTAIFTDELARELSKESDLVTIPRITLDDAIQRTGQAFYVGASAGLVFGVLGIPGGVSGSVQQFNAIKGMAGHIASRETFVEEVATDTNLTDGTPATQEAWKEYLGNVWDKQHEAEPGAATVPERIYTETEQVGFTSDGTTQVLKTGDPETGDRYGYVVYDESETEVRIDDVVSEGDTDVRRELMLELMARTGGKEIVWDVIEDEDTPAATSNIELKQQLIEGNPRGTEAGLQYFEAPVQENVAAEVLTSQVFVQKFGEMFNYTPQQAQAFAPLVEILARTKGEWEGIQLSADEYIAEFIQPRFAQAGEETEAKLAAGEGAAAIGFEVAGKEISPEQVTEFKGLVESVFSAVEGADFHYGMHEYIHAVTALALSPQQNALFETALGKPRAEWTGGPHGDYETIADLYEVYEGAGRAPTPELQTLFQQISDLLWEIVSYIREHLGGKEGAPKLSPEFEAAYDALFTTQRRQEQKEAPQEASPEPVADEVIDTIVHPEAQPPDPQAGTITFDTATVPVLENAIRMDEISPSEDVPNFKREATKGKWGIVAPLKGTAPLKVPSYPVVLWERLSGKLEVITGRHRIELFARLGLEMIPYAQVVREADGFTKEMAITLDAESNIREEKGTVIDYGNYFRNSNITEQEASSRGLLDSDKGRKGFAIGRHATDGLYTLWVNGRITDTKAAAIASVAIDNEALQAEGIKRAGELDPDELINYLNLLNNVTPQNQVEQEDLFGRDESAMVDAAAMAKEAVKVQRGLKSEYNALKAAIRLGKDKQREVVEAYGFEAGDTQAMKGRMNELEDEIRAWTDWTTDPERFAELRERMGSGDTLPLFHQDTGKGQPKKLPAAAAKYRAAASRYFGKTTDPMEAGYMMPNGDMLDFSGRHNSDRSEWPKLKGARTVGHHLLFGEKGSFLNSSTLTIGRDHLLNSFMENTGAARIDFKPGLIQVVPQDVQEYRALVRNLSKLFAKQDSVHIDVEDANGNRLYTFNFETPSSTQIERALLRPETMPPHTLFHRAIEELPPQEPIPQKGTYPAVRTDDGGLYVNTEGYHTHVQFIKAAGIPPTRIVSGGWIADGVYDASERSDTARFVEQEKARQKVEDRLRRDGFLFHRAIEGPALMSLKAKKFFGVTTDPMETGYILPSGEMLDLSGRHQNVNATPGRRTVDHTRLFGSYKQGKDNNPMGLTQDGWAAVIEFQQKSGAVRVDAQFGYASVVGMPTDAQLRQVAKTLNDATREIDVMLSVEVMDHDGMVMADWSVPRVSAGRMKAWFAELSQTKARASALFHSAPDPWILKSVELLRAKMQGPMPGTQIKAMLNKNGVKPDEMKWLNLDEYLETSDKLSLDNVLEFIEQNDVKVEDRILGWPPYKPNAEQKRLADRIGELGTELQTTQEMARIGAEYRLAVSDLELANRANPAHQPTKYETYALAGGAEGTYGELLLTLPQKPTASSAEFEKYRESLRAKYGTDALVVRNATSAELDQLDTFGLRTAGIEYTSPHWNEPNVVAHARYKLHDAADGPVLLVEEIQSDWHQAGRKEGYVVGDEAELLAQAQRELSDAEHQYDEKIRVIPKDEFRAMPLSAVQALPEAQQVQEAKERVFALMGANRVPAAPFQKTWHELTFRRMLRFATEAGVQRIAWTTGQQQADRYRLSNVVDRVRISKHFDGWQLTADKGSSPVLSEEAQSPDAFVPFVGKELVRKAVDEIGEVRNGTALYEGLEMNVGGEGMKAFYDKILVNYANKYGKKWNASVEDVEIEVGGRDVTGALLYGATIDEIAAAEAVPDDSQVDRWRIQVRDDSGVRILPGFFDSKGNATARIEHAQKAAPKNTTVHSLLITPEMNKAVSQGQYLFHQADKWQGQFIYGESIDQAVYQTYVDQAKQFDTLEHFQQMMQGIYAEIDVKAEEITAANRFLAEVFEKAQQQRVRTGQAEGLASNRIKSPDLPEFSQYSRQDKFTAARDIVDKDIARLIESGEVTKADLDRFVLEAESAHDEAQRAVELAEAEDLARRRELDSGPQAIFDLGDDIDRSIDALAAMAADSPRRVQAEARLKDLYRRFRRTLFEDLATAEDLVDEAVWERAIILRETLTEPDLMGRFGEAGEEAVQLGRDLQAAIDDQKLAGELESRTEKHKESRARIYAKKRVDIKRARDKVRETYKAREATRLMRQARIKLMKSIMRPPGKGVEYRGYADTIRQIQDALDPLAPQDRSDYQKLHSRKFLNEHPDAEIYMTEDWLDNIYAQAHPDYSIADLEKINNVIQRLREDGRALRARVVEAERAWREEQKWQAQNATLRGAMPQEFVGGAKPTGKVLQFFIETWKPDRIVQMLQGGPEEGIYQRLLQDDVNAASSLMKKATRKRVSPMKEKMKALKLTLDPLDLRRVTSGFSWLGRPMELGGFRTSNNRKITAQQAMYWSIGMRNDHTRAALLSGNNYPEPVILRAIAQLTDSEAAFAGAIAKDYNANFPRYRDAFIDAFNVDLPGEDNYVSMHRLQRSYETRFEQVGDELLGRTGNRRVYVDRSATHARIEISDEHQTPIRDDLVTLWMEDVISQEGFIHQDALLKRLHAILESDQVTNAIRQKYGEAANKWVKKLINDLAQADAYESQSGIDRVARLARHHQALSYLGFSARTILTQMSGPINFLADAGPLDMGWAAAQYVGGKAKGVLENGVLHNAMVDFVNERTELLRDRNFSQEIDDFRRANPKLYANIIKKIGTAGMKGLAMVDQLTVYIGWRAVYNRTLRQTKGDEAAAIHAADKSVIRTQPSNRVQDTAQMYRHGDVVKLFTQFTSELSVNFNRLTFDIPMAIKRGHVIKAFADLVAIGLVGVSIAVVRGALYKKDDEEKKEAIIRGAAAEFVETMPFIGRDIGNAVAGTYWSSGVSLFPAAQYAIRAGTELIGGDAQDAALAGAQALSLSLGLPYTGVRRAVRAIAEQDAAELLGWK